MFVKKFTALLVLFALCISLASCGEKTPVEQFAKELYDDGPIEERVTPHGDDVTSDDYKTYWYHLSPQSTTTPDFLSLSHSITEGSSYYKCDASSCKGHSVNGMIRFDWYFEGKNERANTIRGRVSITTGKCVSSSSGESPQVKFEYYFNILDLSVLTADITEIEGSISDKIKLYTTDYYVEENEVDDLESKTFEINNILKYTAHGMEYIYATAKNKGYSIDPIA